MTTIKPVLHYLGFIATSNLLWEATQLPLYTVWFDGSVRDCVIAGLHCWIGDILIGAACLAAALVLVGRGWPARRRAHVAFLAIVFGLAYVVYSEWVNVEVRHTWAYSSLMPRLPLLGTGLSPVLQWMVIPPLAFFGALRAVSRGRSGTAVLMLAAVNVAARTTVS